MKLDIAKFQPKPATSVTAQSALSASPTENPNPSSAKLQLESNPTGADIEVDGSFVGNTPSDVQVSEGDHTIAVKKTGFKTWERKMKVSVGSSVHLNAELEKVESP
jgi:PEGA domain